MIVGISGGDFPTRGFLDAYDPQTGSGVWRFYTVPGPGEPGSETWPGAEAMARGGGGDVGDRQLRPELNLLYWGTGNPNPLYYGDDRKGSNLYTASIIAIDADTGKLKWYHQFTPARHPRLGLEPRAGAGRAADRRPAAQGRDGGQSERVLLRVRSRHRQAARRQAVQRHHLGARARRQRPSDRPQRRQQGLPARSVGQHQLHAAVLRSRRAGCSSSPCARRAPTTCR